MTYSYQTTIYSKRICLLTLSDNPDHQEVVYSLWRELYDRGADVYSVGIESPSTTYAESTERNICIKCPSRPGVTLATLNIFRLEKAIRAVASIRPDILYIETVHSWNLPISLRMRRHTAIYQVVHDVDPHDGSSLVRIANSLCAKAADYVVLRNRKDMASASEKLGVESGKIRSLDSWRSFPEYCANTSSGEFLFFGRLRKYKGLSSMLRIAASLPDIRFRVMGKADAESQPIVESLRELANVEVTEGFVRADEMARAFRESDWVLVPYVSASQSGIIMDAYRFSRPVISFDVGAISEQVVDGSTGFLVPPGDIDGFVATVNKAATFSAQTKERFSKAAYEFGIEKYGAQGAAKRFLRMLEM